MAAPFAVFAGLAVWASPNAWLAAVVLASAAFLRGYAAKAGMHNALVMALISLGFIVAVPPSPDTVLAAPIFIAAVCLVAGLWATLVTFMLRNQLSAPDHQHLESIRVLAFSIALAFLVGVATWFVVAFDLGHTGAWIILTIVIVFQPSLGAGFKKAGSRAVGTVLGILAAIAIGAVFPAGPFLYVIGAGALITALYFTLVARPYWWFAASLTLAIVLLESAGSTVEQTAEDRLVATLIGLAGTVAVLLVLSPLSKHLAAGIRPSPSN
jgi:hypothetical protein